MNEKITIQNIADSLVEKHGISKKDAEAVVRGMFDVIKEALATDKYIKIKGLGTFKLTEVESRESVNVNTGERFEIQGHTKISFTPDTIMKDLINKPFAHFETVILNQGTRLDDTVTEIEGEEEDIFSTEQILHETKIPTTTVHEEEIQPTVQIEEAIEEDLPPISSENIVHPEKNESQTETNRSLKETASEASFDTIKETVIMHPESVPLKEPTITNETAPFKEHVIVEETVITSISKTENREEKNETKTKSQISWGIIIIILLVLCIAGGVCWWWFMQTDNQPAEQPPTIPTPLQPKETVFLSDSSVTNKNDSIHKLSVVTSTDTTHIATPAPTIAVPPQQPSAATENRKKEEIANKVTLTDTIEYNITGTKTNYKLQEGETLIKVAVKFYGNKKLWPYIVKHNKNTIRNADVVPTGTTLLIPELSPRKQ